MSLYDLTAERPGGARAIAAARLRRRVLGILHTALSVSEVDSQNALARKLGIRKSAVSQVFRGDGNLRVNTLAEYLHELGFEVDLKLLKTGDLRRSATSSMSAPSISSDTTAGTFAFSFAPESAGVTLHTVAKPPPGSLRITHTETSADASTGSSTLTAELVAS